MQLIDARAVMVDPMKKMLVTPDVVKAKFGVEPASMAEVLPNYANFPFETMFRASDLTKSSG